ncbi:AI-2E family transporter [Alphaproteobacteria bacterium]|nr:AI-2E family transporter [Alphaproteobacteria bacterium]
MEDSSFRRRGRDRRLWGWLCAFVCLALALWLLQSILLPFAAGIAIAYFLNPLAERIQKWGLPRWAAASLILAVFSLGFLAFILALAPVLEEQAIRFAHSLPDAGRTLVQRVRPFLERLTERLSPEDMERVRDAVGNYAGTAVKGVGTFAAGILTSSLVVINILSLAFITPVVAFYLLRDWPVLVEKADRWLPREHAEVIREQLRQIDAMLAGFLRGQGMVCLSLGAFYAISLTAVGLNVGLVVGFSAGAVSFIPYLGSISGFVVGVGLAAAQSPDWTLPVLTALVFLVGQVLEGYVLSPKLVGEKIGLHPVWVIFALLSGGALFGFLGLLIAMPLAAVVGVLTRFFLARYLNSSYYKGRGEASPPDSDAL